jgi:uroporphyrinogen decarboxylase
MRENLLNALAGKNVGAPPIWFMRQAGRYMRSYQKLRASHSFMDLCLIPELATQVTLQPVIEFDTDAAIIFSDILLPLLALGATVQFTEEGPLITHSHNTVSTDFYTELQHLLPGVYQAINNITRTIDRPLIGFIGAPWTLASYLIEGRSPKNPQHIHLLLKTHPQKIEELLRQLEDLVVAHALLQIEAGCHVIQIFESSISLLPDSLVEGFSYRPIQNILNRLPKIPSIVFPIHEKHLVLFKTLSAALSLHHDVNVQGIRKSISSCVQGNLNPLHLVGPAEKRTAAVKEICQAMYADPGFIFNLSGGIPKETQERTIHEVIASVRGYIP